MTELELSAVDYMYCVCTHKRIEKNVDPTASAHEKGRSNYQLRSCALKCVVKTIWAHVLNCLQNYGTLLTQTFT